MSDTVEIASTLGSDCQVRGWHQFSTTIAWGRKTKYMQSEISYNSRKRISFDHADTISASECILTFSSLLEAQFFLPSTPWLIKRRICASSCPDHSHVYQVKSHQHVSYQQQEFLK